ncbi:MAG TPA: anthranilate phosphoribosyltransferase [Chthoniobacterales bacterium]|nr:anthranilate phosphoribosyltransferase [Chthoniobacterales bacterium]
MKTLIEKLRGGVDLNFGDISIAVAALFSDATDDLVKAEFLTALHRKGETVEEILGFVQQLIDRAIDPLIDAKNLAGPMIDVCGTGGDGYDLFNVSTTIMFVLAAGGAVVVKHGNRKVTSCCGSADVLEALGVPFDLPPAHLRECVERLGLCFIFARQYHPAYRVIAGMRHRLARESMRTVFNLLGPLLNPARPARQLIGVFSPHLTSIFAEVLRRLGRERAWVVHGQTDGDNGLDDISTSGATILAELLQGKVTSGVIDSRWLNVPSGGLEELRGGDPAQNAAFLEGILSGEVQGAKRDLTLVNAAGGFVVAGLARDMGEGIGLAREQIDSGRALEKLRGFQRFRATTPA